MSTRLRTFHPHFHLSEPNPVSPDVALTHIQNYLSASATTPHLHPDCLFTESGPISSNTTGGGVILHQLRRVEQGLRGVVLEGEVDADGEVGGVPLPDIGAAVGAGGEGRMGVNGDELPESNDTALDARIAGAQVSAGIPEALGEDQDATVDGNEPPMKDYQEQLRNQGHGIIEGEIGDRTNLVGAGSSAQTPAVQPTTTLSGKKRRRDEVDGGGQGTPATDKAARKRAKKERMYMERREKGMKEQNAVGDRTRDDAADTVEDNIDGDETRELHDEVGPSSKFLPQKISKTTVDAPESMSGEAGQAPQPNGVHKKSAEQEAKDRRESRKKKRKSEVDQSQTSSTTPKDPVKPPAPTATSPPPISSKKDKRKKDKDPHTNGLVNGTKLHSDKPERSRRSSTPSQEHQVNGTPFIPETPQAAPPSKAKPTKPAQETVPDERSRSEAHEARTGGEGRRREERAERKRRKKAEKMERRGRKDEATSAKGGRGSVEDEGRRKKEKKKRKRERAEREVSEEL